VGETAAGSVEDDVRRVGHQMGGSSPMRDEEWCAFNAHPYIGDGGSAQTPNRRATGKARLSDVDARGRNRSRRDLRKPLAYLDDGRLLQTEEGPPLARRPQRKLNGRAIWDTHPLNCPWAKPQPAKQRERKGTDITR
jgi:hypothetical protein